MAIKIVDNMPASLANLPSEEVDIDEINAVADRIASSWRNSVQNILTTAQGIAAASARYQNNEAAKREFENALIKRGIGPSTRSKLKKIGETIHLFKEDHLAYLPASYNALYEICDEEFKKAYPTIISKLKKGDGFEEIKRVLKSNKSKGGKQKALALSAVLSLEANLDEIDDATITKIQNFINAMSKDPENLKISVSRSWNELRNAE